MRRPVLPLALSLLVLLAVPAGASNFDVSFQCCSYSPNVVRALPGDQVTWTGANGATFAQHPLTFPDASIGNQTDASSSTSRSFATEGVYLWYCGVHGHYDPVSNTVSGMSGKVIVTSNTPPTASFTASATDVPTGTEIHFDGTGSSDPDPTQFLNYSWDLDGDGRDDPGQTSPTPSRVYTNTATTPLKVTVRLTVTDTNPDAVGPESGSRSMTITVEPPPAGPTGDPSGGTTGGTTGGGGAGITPDTTPPKLRITKAKLRHGRLRVTFTSSESVAITATLRSGSRKVHRSRDFGAAGSHTLVFKVPAKLRHRRVTLTLAGTDDAGNGGLASRSLRLR
jgi:plastocyanin